MLLELIEESYQEQNGLKKLLPTRGITLHFNEFLTLADPSCFAGNLLNIVSFPKQYIIMIPSLSFEYAK